MIYKLAEESEILSGKLKKKIIKDLSVHFKDIYKKIGTEKQIGMMFYNKDYTVEEKPMAINVYFESFGIELSKKDFTYKKYIKDLKKIDFSKGCIYSNKSIEIYIVENDI